MCITMCDRCKSRLQNGGLTDDMSHLKITDLVDGRTGSNSSNSDLHFRLNSGSDRGYEGAGTSASASSSSSGSHCGAGCTCSVSSKCTGSGQQLVSGGNSLTYRVVRDFDCDSGCTCDQTGNDPDRKRIGFITPEVDLDSGTYPDEKYSSEENLATDRSDSPSPSPSPSPQYFFKNMRDTQHPSARYRLVRRNSDSGILDYKNKPTAETCPEASLSASSDSFKNICCRIHEDLKEALVKGGKLELTESGCKATWKAAIEAVVKAFFKRKTQRENGKTQGKKKEKKTKKEKQVKTIWRRPTPYIYVTDSYGFKVRRPLHPPEYLDKHNYLYLVSYIDRSYISQLARTDF